MDVLVVTRESVEWLTQLITRSSIGDSIKVKQKKTNY